MGKITKIALPRPELAREDFDYLPINEHNWGAIRTTVESTLAECKKLLTMESLGLADDELNEQISVVFDARNTLAAMVELCGFGVTRLSAANPWDNSEHLKRAAQRLWGWANSKSRDVATEYQHLELVADEVKQAVESFGPAGQQASQQTSRRHAAHSKDFRSVQWFGTVYTFTDSQAAVVRALWESWENGTPDISHRTALDSADAPFDRLQDVFKRGGKMHPAWGTMIVTSAATKGTCRLQPPV